MQGELRLIDRLIFPARNRNIRFYDAESRVAKNEKPESRL